MEDFKWNQKENYSNEDLKELLKQHQGFIEKTQLKPKLEAYENKINSYEEQQLFSHITDPKKVDLIKNLMTADQYKALSKAQAFEKVNLDFKDVLAEKPAVTKVENKAAINNFNPTKLIMDLHNNSIDPVELETRLKQKASTTGISDPKELEDFIEIAKKEALNAIK